MALELVADLKLWLSEELLLLRDLILDLLRLGDDAALLIEDMSGVENIRRVLRHLILLVKIIQLFKSLILIFGLLRN